MRQAAVFVKQPCAKCCQQLSPMPEWVLGAFQPVGREQLTPAGTELENTLAESHFPGERDFAALSRLLWQQVVLARDLVSLRQAICFPTASRKAAAVRLQEVPGAAWTSGQRVLCWGPHRPSRPDAWSNGSSAHRLGVMSPVSSGSAWRLCNQPDRLLGIGSCL